MYKLDLKKADEPKDQTANIHWFVEKAREFQGEKKKIYFCFVDYAKAFVWITAKYGKFLKRCMRVRSNRTGHGTMNCFRIGKGV